MVFKCQENSFLKEFTTKVIRCDSTVEPIVDYGRTSCFEGYQIVLENTILFPAGGGQPHDIGWLNGIEVFQVIQKGNEAVHYTKEPIETGTTVTQRINWDRRFDHMQQHSGQHLLSAILEKEYKFKTTSWWLGADICYVELGTPDISSETMQNVEDRCNELIRANIPVTVNFYESNDPDLDKVHSRGLPNQCMDTIRVVCIDGVDANMCCGTHVSNLSQLQVVKLLAMEPIKGCKVNLKFIVGSRVTRAFQRMLDREKALTGLLNNEPSKHKELVMKLQKNIKTANKNLQTISFELAQYESEKIKTTLPQLKYMVLFKKEATPEFNRAISKSLENESIFLLLASENPDKPKEGQVIIQGPEEHCNALAQQIIQTLKGRGAFKSGKFQGKAEDLGGMKQCQKLIEDYFNDIQQ